MFIISLENDFFFPIGEDWMQIKRCVITFLLLYHLPLKMLILQAKISFLLSIVSQLNLNFLNVRIIQSCFQKLINAIIPCRFIATWQRCMRKSWFHDCPLLRRAERTEEWPLPQDRRNHRKCRKMPPRRIPGKNWSPHNCSSYQIFVRGGYPDINLLPASINRLMSHHAQHHAGGRTIYRVAVPLKNWGLLLSTNCWRRFGMENHQSKQMAI